MTTLKPVSRVTLGEQVAAQLADQITQGRWQIGEKLPSENELCSTLGIGRSTLREALKSLAYVGMIRMRPGEGTYVAGTSQYLSNRILADGRLKTEKQLDDVGEARLILETELAALAAERAEPGDLQRLESLLADMGRSLETGEGRPYAQLDVEFHLAIAKTSKNAVLIELFTAMRAVLHEWISKSQELPGVAANAHVSHTKILEALRQHKPEKARRAMRAHLHTCERAFTLLDKISKTAEIGPKARADAHPAEQTPT
jgi:GntR family transcriptional regulator, transcriptional repressor for pyruvate dehydrogenase complex